MVKTTWRRDNVMITAEQVAAPTATPGLSTREAAERLASGGANVLPARHRVRLWRRIAMQVRDPLVLVLLVAAALTIATGDWTDAADHRQPRRPLVQGVAARRARPAPRAR
jgi:magnesium-transporting ATPase (P-type)